MKSNTVGQLLAGKNGQKLIDAEIVLAHLIGQDKIFVITYPEHKLNKLEFQSAKLAMRKLAAGQPVAYLIGYKEFYGLNFFVNKNTLIPRPETELLTEEAINILRSPAILIDIGTGSGCIPISIVKILARENIMTMASDISYDALNIAKKNAKKHKVKINFKQGDLLQPWKYIIQKAWRQDKQIVITANLPYLTYKQFSKESSIRKEPRQALVADAKNGLSLYKKLFKQVAEILPDKNTGNLTLLAEINPGQTKAIVKLIKKSLLRARIAIKKDLAGRNRLVKINL